MSTWPRCAKPAPIRMSVRRRSELDEVDGLVIPGGESTTMSHLLLDLDLLEPLRGGWPAGCRPTARAPA